MLDIRCDSPMPGCPLGWSKYSPSTLSIAHIGNGVRAARTSRFVKIRISADVDKSYAAHRPPQHGAVASRLQDSRAAIKRAPSVYGVRRLSDVHAGRGGPVRVAFADFKSDICNGSNSEIPASFPLCPRITDIARCTISRLVARVGMQD
jgi:hypothetical protein